jgi:hypothetical protein
MGIYKLSLQLFKTFNSAQQSKDWQDLANQIIITRRQTKFENWRSTNYGIGLSLMAIKSDNLSKKNKSGVTEPKPPIFQKIKEIQYQALALWIT